MITVVIRVGANCASMDIARTGASLVCMLEGFLLMADGLSVAVGGPKWA